MSEKNLTITEILDEFLVEQKARWAASTYAKYDDIIGLFKHYLNNYWPNHDGQYSRVTKAGGTFCTTYGVEEIATHFGMFLDYFIPRKVMGSNETETSARRVIRKLAKWLVAKGYDPDARDFVD